MCKTSICTVCPGHFEKVNSISSLLALGLLWTAPELLLDIDEYPWGTKEGDVYSFSIVLHEIFFRLGPFPGCEHLTAKGRVPF